MAAHKNLISLVVKAFFLGLSRQIPPFDLARKHINSASFGVLSYPHQKDNIIQVTLSEYVTNIEEFVLQLHKEGVKYYEECFSNSPPEVWVDGNFASVWTSHHAFADGKLLHNTYSVFSLHKIEDTWKITGVASTQVQPDVPAPPISSKPTPEIMLNVEYLFESIRSCDWDKFLLVLLPDAGASLSRPPLPLENTTWPKLVKAFVEAADKLPPGVFMDPRPYDVEVRAVEDLAFVWMHLKVSINGKPLSSGSSTFTLLHRDGNWLISGIQDVGRQAQ